MQRLKGRPDDLRDGSERVKGEAGHKMGPESSSRALDAPPIAIAVLTLLLVANAVGGECPSAEGLMQSRVI